MNANMPPTRRRTTFHTMVEKGAPHLYPIDWQLTCLSYMPRLEHVVLLPVKQLFAVCSCQLRLSSSPEIPTRVCVIQVLQTYHLNPPAKSIRTKKLSAVKLRFKTCFVAQYHFPIKNHFYPYNTNAHAHS